ncbi:MAG: hypothetical protein GY774_22125 [Planctomycetes bacterium]|nr:hypothetical protein [Planctomycetota bacterium]
MMPQHSAVTQLQMRTRPYEHKPFINPFGGVPEAFVQGVYESPGELARLGEAVGSVSLPGMVANMMGYKSGFSDWVDEQTGVNELGYNPDDYEATKALQGLARMGGNVVGDPLNAIPGGYLAGKFGKELGGEIVNQAVKPSMSKQAGILGEKALPMGEASRMQRAEQEGFDYVRRHNSEDGMVNGMAMFVQRPNRIGNTKLSYTDSIDYGMADIEMYGDNLFLGRAGEKSIGGEDFKNMIKTDMLDTDIDEINGRFGTSYDSKDEFINDFNPGDIVDSAGAWDIPTLSEYGWELLYSKNLDSVVTDNGLLAFDPKNIRSKFAKFDPAKKDSAKLLASGLLGSTLINQDNE